MRTILIPNRVHLGDLKAQLISILKDLNYLSISNHISEEIEARKGLSWRSYGETITINIYEIDAGYHIVVKSKSKSIQLIDWGTNSENEEEITNAIESQFL